MKVALQMLKASLIMLALAVALAPLPGHPLAMQAVKAQEQRGIGVEIKVEDGKTIKLYDKSYALVIGISDYTNGWPKLPGVKGDIQAIRAVLEKQGFQVVVKEDLNSVQLDEVFRTFIQQYGLNVENRLLFYFAGHGHTVTQSYGDEMGYLVPSDAPNPNRDLTGFLAKAMDMQQMELYARRIQAKHALFLFDSCFSGSLFALSRAVPDNISYKTSRPVRQFITSGSADEQVPDQSIFRRQVMAALEGEADRNRDNYVTGTELGEFLQDTVVNYSRNAQHPQYGKIRNPNLDKGDFVFALPKAAVVRTPPEAAKTTPTMQPVDPVAIELSLWETIRNSTDPEDFKEYLEKYPQGQFAGVARRRLAALTGGGAKGPSEGAANTAAASPPARPKPGTVVRSSAGVELVYVPAGSFMMGSENGGKDEKPVHQVTIREGFYMGRYEVTQGQWQAVMGTTVRQQRDKAHPLLPLAGEGDNYPMYYVRWEEAQQFIQKLNAQNDGFIYRLPSEAEWEYACRAGTAGDYAGSLDAVAWYGNNSGRQYLDAAAIYRADSGNYSKRLTDNGNQTHPVGEKQANAFGLYDMHGNVWEWCEDAYHENYNGAPTDGSAWLSGADTMFRVLRGGSWYNNAYYLRSAVRYRDVPGRLNHHLGFRVAAAART